MDQIQNFDSVLSINGTTFKPTFSEFTIQKDRDYRFADWQWEEIAKAYNKLRDPNYVVDYLNDDQDKNYPWAILKKDDSQPSGFGFSDSDYLYTENRLIAL